MPSSLPCQPGCTCKKHSYEFRAQVAERNKRVFGGKPKSSATKAKMSVTHTGKTMPPKTPEQLARQGASMRAYWASLTPEARAQRIAKSVEGRNRAGRTVARVPNFNTKLELYLADLLTILGFSYRRNIRIGPFLVDFLARCSDGRGPLIIEANGCYWHDCPSCFGSVEQRPGKRTSDADRRAYLEDLGFQVIELWEHELPASADGAVIFDDE